MKTLAWKVEKAAGLRVDSAAVLVLWGTGSYAFCTAYQPGKKSFFPQSWWSEVKLFS